MGGGGKPVWDGEVFKGKVTAVGPNTIIIELKDTSYFGDKVGKKFIFVAIDKDQSED